MGELQLKTSVHRRSILVFLMLAAAILLAIAAVGRYPLAVLPFAGTMGWLLGRSWRDPVDGMVIRWTVDNWWLKPCEHKHEHEDEHEEQSKGDWAQASLAVQPVCLCWVMKLVFRCQGSGQPVEMLVFNDAAAPEALKALRRRVLLDASVGGEVSPC